MGSRSATKLLATIDCAGHQSAVATLLERFLDPSRPSLKICGVTTGADAERLAEMRVPALGVNFWEKSKRYCAPAEARSFLPLLAERILRVGVFVNADPAEPRTMLETGLIDLAQFHGDESIDYCTAFAAYDLPFIKAIGVRAPDDLQAAASFGARAILLDAHAPGLYGGTGHTIDWNLAADFVASHPRLPIILAGGLTPENASPALASVRPAALDVASGAERSPGVKDFAKVEAFLRAVTENAN